MQFSTAFGPDGYETRVLVDHSLENFAMTEQLASSGWKKSQLPAVLAGDIAAATISATVISPILTAIDRCGYKPLQPH
jgi:hypothetical protein